LTGLLIEYLFDFPDFVLDFAAQALLLAFGLEVWVVRELAHLLFGVTLYLMNLALKLIFFA
jgi:hypothetical protein